MAHHTYTTTALVLGGSAQGESDRFFALFTRELGLLRALGKSVRMPHSKLRYHLQDFSYGRVTLVRGRSVWRITGAASNYNLYALLDGAREKQLLMLQICALLSRLLQGEEPDQELFDLILGGMDFLQVTPMDAPLVKDFEYVFVIRILARLGYVGNHSTIHTLLSPEPFSREKLLTIAPIRKEALNAINEALLASGL